MGHPPASAAPQLRTLAPRRAPQGYGAAHPCRAAAVHMPTPLCVSNIVAFGHRELGKWCRRKGKRYQRRPPVAVNCSSGRQSHSINTNLQKITHMGAAARCTPAAPQAPPRRRPAAAQVRQAEAQARSRQGPAARQLHPSRIPAVPQVYPKWTAGGSQVDPRWTLGGP